MSEEISETGPNKKNMRILLALLPLLLFAALAAIFFKQLVGGSLSSNIPSALLGKTVPQFDMPALEGLNRNGVPVPGLKTEDLKGKFSVVNVWASWCVPCRQEHPILIELAKDKRLNLVGINYKDKNENALRFLGQLGNPFAAVGADTRGRAAIEWGVYGIPETFVVGPDATILYKQVGLITPKTIAKIKELAEAARLKKLADGG